MCRDHCSVMRSFPHLDRFHGEKKIRKEILKVRKKTWRDYYGTTITPPATPTPFLHLERLHDKKEMANEILKVRKKTWGEIIMV